MNQQEFNNLKVGDKVVVARVVNPRSGRYQGLMNPVQYLDKQGTVEDVYSIGGSGIEVLFEEGISWYFNIEDIDLITEKETDMQKTRTQHKHAAIIKAWADGEEIEFLTSKGVWCKVGSCPAWSYDEYRIKPKFEKRYKYAFLSGSGWYISSSYYKDDSTFRTESGYSGSIFEKIEASGKDFQCN